MKSLARMPVPEIVGILILSSIAIFPNSCQNNPENVGESKTGFGSWNIMDSTVQHHSYTKTGLLDSTLKTWYHYRNGETDLHLNTLITREYDTRGNLKEERFFDYLNESNKWDLTGKSMKDYDSRGNLVLDILFDIKKSKQTISSLNRRTYNINNQEITRVEILKKLEPYPKEWTTDSMLMHYKDKKILKYDTFNFIYSYDKNGSLVTETSGSPGQPTEHILYSTYSQGTKKNTCSLNANGDTNFIYRYDQEGDLIRKTTEYKKIPLYYNIDTTWYRGNNKVKWVFYNNKSLQKGMKIYRYDVKGNQIQEISYN